MRILCAAAAALVLAAALSAQDFGEAPKTSFALRGSATLGTDSLLTGPRDSEGNPTPESWTRLGFRPDIAFGKIGIGLDLTLRFKLYPTADEAVRVYEGDWVPGYHGNGKNFFDVYLPKLLYLRYGVKGEDPLFAKLGSIDDLSLGDGFIVGNYSNMRFMPEQRLIGLDFGVDGALFDYPYVGFEALTGNLARFDLVGGRIFTRPLADITVPVLKTLEVGLTAAMDRAPLLYDPEREGEDVDAIVVYGLDLRAPISGDTYYPLTAFADLAFEPNGAAGGMVGVEGRLARVLLYGAQLRLLEAGFIPVYFDANYDLYRAEKYDFMQLSPSGPAYFGYLASLGFAFLDDAIMFRASLDGPFKLVPKSFSSDQTEYPHARAVFRLGEGMLGGFFFDASYEKYFLGASKGVFTDLTDPTDAVLGLAINYRTGASILTLLYNESWDPVAGHFNVRSSLQATVEF